jgi:hypothetical protein
MPRAFHEEVAASLDGDDPEHVCLEHRAHLVQGRDAVACKPAGIISNARVGGETRWANIQPDG